MNIEHRRLGRTGLSVSVLGFGGSEIGFERSEQETVDRLLNEALDAGLNVIDTAECYLGSEEAIGKAVAHRRGEYHLFSKVGHEHGLGSGEDWSPESILRTIDRSLKRLRTDRLDLVQLHSCSIEILRKGEAIDALERARHEGKTRFIGYSGDSTAARFAVETGRFDTLQTSISIADQEALELTLPAAREQGMGVIAKRPIANAAWRYDDTPSNGYHTEYWQRLRILDYPFTSGPARSDQGPVGAGAIALRFTLSQPGVHTAIVGTTRPGRWQANARIAAAGPLNSSELNAIRARWTERAGSDWTGQI